MQRVIEILQTFLDSSRIHKAGLCVADIVFDPSGGLLEVEKKVRFLGPVSSGRSSSTTTQSPSWL